MIVTGIGSRSTPKAILTEMEKIGDFIRSRGHWLRSGHADGADWAFEQGAKEQSIVYLPWDNFGKPGKKVLGTSATVTVPTVTVEQIAQLDEVVNKAHPAPDRLTRGARSLMRRNVCQILGLNMDSPSDCLVMYSPWTDEGTGLSVQGGTNLAFQVARMHKIPWINMYTQDYGNADRVIRLLIDRETTLRGTSEPTVYSMRELAE